MRRHLTTVLAVGTAGILLLPPAASAFGASAGARPLPATARYAVLDTVQPTGTASPELTAVLVAMREEERMARDLYAGFLAAYPDSRPFSRIVLAEQRHFDAVGRLLTAYGITDPSTGRATGSYADPALQSAYDGWKSAGAASKTAAYQAAVELEKRDIADLEKAIATTTDTQVSRVLNRLLTASKRHLAVYTQAAAGNRQGKGLGQGGAGKHVGMGSNAGQGQNCPDAAPQAS